MSSGRTRPAGPTGRAPIPPRASSTSRFVLYGYLAGLTESLELVTAVIILPQRQTALVAKQAASLDVLSGGRLRLGIGTGWNDVEYEALGENFHDRGARSEEQIDVMRKTVGGRHDRLRRPLAQGDRRGSQPPARAPVDSALAGRHGPAGDRAGRTASRMAGSRSSTRNSRRSSRRCGTRRAAPAATRPTSAWNACSPWARRGRRNSTASVLSRTSASPHGRHHHEPGPGPGRPRGRHLPVLGRGGLPRVLKPLS